MPKSTRTQKCSRTTNHTWESSTSDIEERVISKTWTHRSNQFLRYPFRGSNPLVKRRQSARVILFLQPQFLKQIARMQAIFILVTLCLCAIIRAADVTVVQVSWLRELNRWSRVWLTVSFVLRGIVHMWCYRAWLTYLRTRDVLLALAWLSCAYDEKILISGFLFNWFIDNRSPQRNTLSLPVWIRGWGTKGVLF